MTYYPSEAVILNAASVIKTRDRARRLQQSVPDVVSIRWDIPMKAGLDTSYYGFQVPREVVESLIAEHFAEKIALRHDLEPPLEPEAT